MVLSDELSYTLANRTKFPWQDDSTEGLFDDLRDTPTELIKIESLDYRCNPPGKQWVTVDAYRVHGALAELKEQNERLIPSIKHIDPQDDLSDPASKECNQIQEYSYTLWNGTKRNELRVVREKMQVETNLDRFDFKDLQGIDSRNQAYLLDKLKEGKLLQDHELKRLASVSIASHQYGSRFYPNLMSIKYPRGRGLGLEVVTGTTSQMFGRVLVDDISPTDCVKFNHTVNPKSQSINGGSDEGRTAIAGSKAGQRGWKPSFLSSIFTPSKETRGSE